MICNSCSNEFINIYGLKFCPYCGSKTENATENIYKEAIDEEESIVEKNIIKETLLEEEIIIEDSIKEEIDKEEIDKEEVLEEEIDEEEVLKEEIDKKEVIKAEIKKSNHENTLPMPAITDEDIKNHNKKKYFNSFKITLKKMKVMIPIIVILFIITGGVFAYTKFSVKAVNEVRIKEDMLGKTITMPKGTAIKITKEYMKNLTISSRSKDKDSGNDIVKVSLTLNNDAIEVKTLLSLEYIYQGKKQWKMDEKIILEGVTELKPVAAMDENQFLETIKKLSIDVAGTSKLLGAEDVKSLGITTRTPDLDNNKEVILLAMNLDSDLLAATGNIKCNLVFNDESWNVETVERNSTEDFKLVLSPNFSDAKIIEAIKKESLKEAVSYEDFWGGQEFKVNDSFTRSINVSDKKFDEQKGTLNVTAKRENVAGEVNTTLSTGYAFKIDYTNVSFLSKSKTIVDSAKINDLTSTFIIKTIANRDIEGGNILFLFSDNHKITNDEANTFKLDKIVSKIGFKNVKYSYGSVNLQENKKVKNAKFIGLYFLVYEDEGYKWRLSKIVGEDSPDYKKIKKETEN